MFLNLLMTWNRTSKDYRRSIMIKLIHLNSHNNEWMKKHNSCLNQVSLWKYVTKHDHLIWMFKQELNRHVKTFQIKFACGWILYIIKKNHCFCQPNEFLDSRERWGNNTLMNSLHCYFKCRGYAIQWNCNNIMQNTYLEASNLSPFEVSSRCSRWCAQNIITTPKFWNTNPKMHKLGHIKPES